VALRIFVLAMDMVLQPLNTKDCQKSRGADDLPGNSAQKRAADESGNKRDSRGDQRWANVAPRIFPVKDPSQCCVAEHSLDEIGQKNTKRCAHCTEPRDQPEEPSSSDGACD